MKLALFCKLLRDMRWPLFWTAALLAAYEALWVRVTDLITQRVMPVIIKIVLKSGRRIQDIEKEDFADLAEMLKSFLGGELLDITNPLSTLTIGYVHPFVLTVFCIWAIGRASGALAGEIDRGTMELLLAQPVTRRRVVLSHLGVDAVVIPCLCASMLFGTWLGQQLVRLPAIDWMKCIGATVNAAAFLFAISGYTMALSALGRLRGRVLSLALGVTLVQFIVNVLGGFWDALAPFRPLTVFYYYQPQPIILKNAWTVPIGLGFFSGISMGEVNVAVVLVAVGALGYAVALVAFSRRDLPAPL